MGNLSKHFSSQEFSCHCGCGASGINLLLVDLLETIRTETSKSITILSGCRCEKHNKACGGKPHSQHLLGNAADIQIAGLTPIQVHEVAEKLLRGKGGVGLYETFVHVDVRANGPARWNG